MKTNLFYLLSLCALVSLSNCTTLHIYVGDSFRNQANEYAVSGRQNAFKREMSFGKFHFTNVKKGWVTSNSSVLFFKKQDNAKSKLSFKLKAGGLETETFCAAQAQMKSLVFGRLQIYEDMNDVYSGMIQFKDGATWDFFIKNTNNLHWNNPSMGYATDGTTRIDIQDVRKADGETPRLLPSTIFGYTFSIDREQVAVVETIGNKGNVWIKKGLDKEIEITLANLSAALLLRPDLSQNVDNRF
ncbi:MAG: hypothetical protein JNL70_04695 [Saprospiraceae bacterium]|nr:hypothetical protein [Saprospiraceae bacterium]